MKNFFTGIFFFSILAAIGTAAIWATFGPILLFAVYGVQLSKLACVAWYIIYVGLISHFSLKES